uniref:Uncharacterized protein n=1 Tax=Sphaerodactylus townsendi TaxID=933632 RepID=A0ACB8FZY3_9SAUR
MGNPSPGRLPLHRSHPADMPGDFSLIPRCSEFRASNYKGIQSLHPKETNPTDAAATPGHLQKGTQGWRMCYASSSRNSNSLPELTANPTQHAVSSTIPLGSFLAPLLKTDGGECGDLNNGSNFRGDSAPWRAAVWLAAAPAQILPSVKQLESFSTMDSSQQFVSGKQNASPLRAKEAKAMNRLLWDRIYA